MLSRDREQQGGAQYAMLRGISLSTLHLGSSSLYLLVFRTRDKFPDPRCGWESAAMSCSWNAHAQKLLVDLRSSEAG
ncbi:hypothetical protein BJY04DRAFT_170468 [Aspergillus karnatakaensis]|uniref:uncharacterized protein n=1 Tax=Aspergillus karnatakaensis TaxID=1810916 RepID=UPI003CCE337C